MDILDVGLTINEFKMEWTIKYTPNDVSFWAPLLDSDLPIQKLCAFDLFLAWGRESVIEAYMKWEDCRNRRAELYKEYKENLDSFEQEYEMHSYEEEYGHYYISSGGRKRGIRQPVSSRELKQARFRKYFDATDYHISTMTWMQYMEKKIGVPV